MWSVDISTARSKACSYTYLTNFEGSDHFVMHGEKQTKRTPQGSLPLSKTQTHDWTFKAFNFMIHPLPLIHSLMI